MNDNALPLFPQHKAGMTLEHNDHKTIYQSASDWMRENEEHFRWRDEDSKRRAIATDNIWTLHWYPNTPVGFCSVAAPTLYELLDLAKEEADA